MEANPRNVELAEVQGAVVDDIIAEVDLGEPVPLKTDPPPAAATVSEESKTAQEEPKSWVERKGEAFEKWMEEDWEHFMLFWEEGYEGPPPEQLGFKGRTWHRFRHVVNKTLAGAEFVGEVTVNVLGLNESKYQWVIDALEEEKRQKEQKKLEDAQRRMLREQERERKAAAREQERERKAA